MFRKLFFLFSFLTISLSASTYWIDNQAANGGDGSETYPWNSISSINWGIDQNVVLNFIPSPFSYTANDLQGELCFIRILRCTSFVIQKAPNYNGEVILDGEYINDYGIKAVPSGTGNILNNVTVNDI